MPKPKEFTTLPAVSLNLDSQAGNNISLIQPKPATLWEETVYQFVQEKKDFWTFEDFLKLCETIRQKFPEMTQAMIASALQHARDHYRASLQSKEHRFSQRMAQKIRENTTLLQSSGLISEFLKRTEGLWSESDWQSFCREIQKRLGIYLPESDIRALVGYEEMLYRKRRELIYRELAFLKLLEEEGEYAECEEMIGYLHEQNVPDELLRPLSLKIEQKQQALQTATDKANELLAQNKFEQAEEFLAQAVALSPKSALLRQSLALARDKKEQERSLVASALQKVRRLCNQEDYSTALATLTTVAECRLFKDEIARWQIALEGKLSEIKAHHEKMLELWAGERFVSIAPATDQPADGTGFSVPAADFSDGVTPALARAYQEDYAQRTGQPLELVLELPEDATITLRLIPPASFPMGCRTSTDFPVHSVILPKPFYCAIHPVTQAQWEAVTGKPPSQDKGPDYPVERISWDEAKDFCHKLSQFRGALVALPSEAQWEYVCRAGSLWTFCCGEDSRKLGEFAWYVENSQLRTSPVGLKQPNAWGIFDMHGQVWEWCEDWYAPYPTGLILSPRGPLHGKEKVMRGGNVCASAAECSSFFRKSAQPGNCTQITGFRLVMPANG